MNHIRPRAPRHSASKAGSVRVTIPVGPVLTEAVGYTCQVYLEERVHIIGGSSMILLLGNPGGGGKQETAINDGGWAMLTLF